MQDGAGDAVEALVVAAHDDFVERGLSGENAVYYLFVCQASDFVPSSTSIDSPVKRVRGSEKGYKCLQVWTGGDIC